MTFGNVWGWGTAKDKARMVYDTLREAWGIFMNMANAYTVGTSESLPGEFMKDRRCPPGA